MNAKISVIIITLGRETLYPLIENLLKQKINKSYEIILIPQHLLKEELLVNKKIKIFYEPLGKGFAYYRNAGVRHSTGDVLAFIDDDEMPTNLSWLYTLTKPILDKNEIVTTSGCRIPLGQGYLTDCISLLGFPGGGAVGFKVMWKVDKIGYTSHLCSGNFAIHKNVLQKINGFSNEMKYGNEDVDLADKLIGNTHLIKYLDSATVFHVARGYAAFAKWQLLRGMSAGTYLSKHISKEKPFVSNRLSAIKKIIFNMIERKAHYLPGFLFILVNQYIYQGLGLLMKSN